MISPLIPATAGTEHAVQHGSFGLPLLHQRTAQIADRQWLVVSILLMEVHNRKAILMAGETVTVNALRDERGKSLRGVEEFRFQGRCGVYRGLKEQRVLRVMDAQEGVV